MIERKTKLVETAPVGIDGFRYSDEHTNGIRRCLRQLIMELAHLPAHK